VDGISPDKIMARFATSTGENIAWLEAHEADVLRQHPEWENQYVAVASRTPSKIVAVAARRAAAVEEGLKSPELLALARQEGMPPGSLLTPLLLGPARNLADLSDEPRWA
jgi:hypothetical protein